MARHWDQQKVLPTERHLDRQKDWQKVRRKEMPTEMHWDRLMDWKKD